MADTNQESQQLAETLAKLREAFDGSEAAVRKRTDAEMKAKHGVENFSAGTAKAASALGALGGAGAEAAKAMLEGKKGAAAFNGAVDGMADAAKMAGAALTLMIPGGPVIKLLIAGMTAAVTAYAEFTKAANQMSDTLHKGYQGLAKSGAAASDGMTGLFKDAKKLGVSMNELDGYVQLIGANSKDLALFSGSVADGRKRFAEIGKEMEPFRAGLLNAGMSLEEQREATMGYLRLQSRVGQTQNKTTEELAAGARRYLLEQDALTKLTGMTRKEQEDAREEIRSQERFAATLAEMRAKGQHNEAKALEDTYLVLRSQSKEAAQGFADVSTGMLTTEAAQKSYIATQGESMRVSQQIQAGQLSAAQGAQRVAKAHGDTAESLRPLAKMGVFGDLAGDYAGSLRLGVMGQKDLDRELKKIEEDRKKQGVEGGQAADSLVQAQTDLNLAQVAANEATEKFIFQGVVPATENMILLAKATGAVANSLSGGRSPELRTNKRTGTEQDQDGYYEYQRQEMEALGQKPEEMGSFWKNLFGGRSEGSLGATGKLIEDFGSGTPMMLHGREGVITEQQLTNLAKSAMAMGSRTPASGSGTAGSGSSAQADQMHNLQQEMLKDTEQLAKITDQDLRRTREFTRTNLKLMNLKSDLMEDEIELLEEQNKMLADIEKIYTETMGPEAAKAAVTAFKRTQMMGGMAGMGSMGGMPSPAGASGGPSAPTEVEGARYGSGKAASELLQFTGASGSASAFEGLNSRLKDSVLAAAEEYHAATGNRMQVNSAKRDPSDQERLWNDSVARGTPGRGPTGMAVAPPGRSPHEKGLAIDIQNYNDPAAVAAMNRQGLKQKVPGDPVHFSFADGGVATGPRSGYLAELHGPEAVVPLPDGKTIPVRIEGGDAGGTKSKDMDVMMNQFRLSMESMINQLNNRDLLNMMDEMVRAQKASNSIQEKLLRAAAN
jgi:hypothetical protein